jgi:hypothetical protein
VIPPVTRWVFREDLASGLNPYFAALAPDQRTLFVEHQNAVDAEGTARLGPDHWIRLVDPHTGQFVTTQHPAHNGAGSVVRIFAVLGALFTTAVISLIALALVATSNLNSVAPSMTPPSPAPTSNTPNPVPSNLRAPTPTSGPGWKRFAANPRYNPCAPIYWRYNPAGAPTDRLNQVQGAIGTIAAASGLNFTYDGYTTDIPGVSDPKGYDLTIGWTDADHVPDLAGSRTLALGGSIYYRRSDGITESEHGYVAINVDHVADSKGEKLTLVLEYELGHVIGLAHSDDPKALMYAELGPDQHGLTAPDLAGLRAVGSEAGCIDQSLRKSHPAPHPAA